MLRRREEKRSAGCDAQGSVLTAEEKRRESCDGGADMRRALCSMLRRREENGRDAGRDEMLAGKRNENLQMAPSTFYIFTLFLFYPKLKMN